MSIMTEHCAKTPFEVPSYVWSGEDEDCFGTNSDNCNTTTMPSSPDTVCVDKVFFPNNNCNNVDNDLMMGAMFFDAEFFSDKQNDFETFRLFDTGAEAEHDSETSFTDDASETSSSVTELRSNIVTAKRSVETVIQEQPLKKRRQSSFSDSGDEETKTTKKAKASPKLPRSRKPTSAFRGVSRCTKDGRWQARIRVAKEVVYLGRFPTEEQAARRYDEAARLHHGSQAMLNFVTPEDIVLGRKSVFSQDKIAVDQDEF